MNTLFIDGHNFLFRSYAVPFKFYSKNGTQLQVISIFLGLLRRAIKVTNADQITVVFDSDSETDNHQLLPEYKANRDKDFSNEEMSPYEHIPLIQKALEIVNIPWYEELNVEADDVIASLSTRILKENKKSKSYIASTDSDFFQLLDKNCKMLKFLPKKENLLVDPEYIIEKYSVAPKQYVELKAWVGDTADNIKGIRGIGWKRGAEIINGTRERELSVEEKEVFERNLKLIRLNCDLDLESRFVKPEKLMAMSNKEVIENSGF